MSPATDWIENLRAAVWTWIEADEDFDTTRAAGVMFKGTLHKFEAGLKTRMQIEPAVCPILAMAPMGPLADPSRPAGRGEDTERSCTLRFGLYALGPETAKATALYTTLVARLRAGLLVRPAFNHSDLVREIDIESGELAPFKSEKDPKLMWAIPFDLAVSFRHGTDPDS